MQDKHLVIFRRRAGAHPDRGARIPANPSARIQELDGVRGCAILLVLCWHFVFDAIQARPATFWSYFQSVGRLTWSGVDLFFVLSGFLIGGILIDSRNSQDYFRTFYVRRFYRIVPLYIVMLGIVLVVNRGTIDRQIPTFAYFAFLQNFWMARYATFGAFLAPTWSLAVEEQFYLTLPSFVRLTKPKYLAYLVALGVLLAPCVRILLLLGWPSSPFVSFVLMPCRADALLLGVLGAIAIRNVRANHWLQNNGQILLILLLIFATGIGLLTAHGASWNTKAMRSVGYTWLAVFYLGVILYVLTQRQSWLAHTMRWRWLGWLGSIAYGVYLVHQMIARLVFLDLRHSNIRLSNWRDIVAVGIAVILTLAICRISWLMFERRLIQLGHRQGYPAADPLEATVKRLAAS